jgi:hypothetical protein
MVSLTEKGNFKKIPFTNVIVERKIVTRFLNFQAFIPNALKNV